MFIRKYAILIKKVLVEIFAIGNINLQTRLCRNIIPNYFDIGNLGFYIYGVICAVAVLFMWLMVTETKGKSLEEIEKMWK